MAQSTTSTQIFRTEHESLLYEVREEPAGHRSSWDPGMYRNSIHLTLGPAGGDR